MKKRFTEKIIAVLKQADAGAKVAELCRRYGISDATYHNLKAKFGGMAVSDCPEVEGAGSREREAQAVRQFQGGQAGPGPIAVIAGHALRRFLTGDTWPKGTDESQ